MRFVVILIILVSLVPKAFFSAQLPFDADFVPIVWWGWDWLNGGVFPTYGTLSSVGAYNLPFLVWLHLPALVLTRDPQMAILATLLWVNVLGMACVYALGRELFNARVGLGALILYAFSETVITSAYTAWAQVLLPAFFAFVGLALWRWYRTGRGRYLAAAGVLATCAFMMHFSAILLFPVLLVFWLLSRAQWSWRGVGVGTVICVALLLPYGLFQVQRDFSDLRAFITRTPQVPSETMAFYRDLAYPPENSPLPLPDAPNTPQDAPSSAVKTPPTLATRALNEASTALGVLVAFAPLSSPSGGIVGVLALCAIGLALLWGLPHTLGRWRTLAEHAHGRAVLLALMSAVFLGGMLITRTLPTEQPTYLMGLLAWGSVLVAWAIDTLLTRLGALRWRTMLLWGACVCVAMVSVGSRIERQATREDTLFPQAWYFNSVARVVDAIAQDWNSPNALTVAYDTLPEMRFQWWALAWHTVDARYRQTMAYDFLLLARHNLQNKNTSAIGTAETYDYLVVFTDGLSRYDDGAYDVQILGKIALLKPR